MRIRFAAACCALSFSFTSAALEVSGLLRANYVFGDGQTSYQNGGTGILRYDDDQLTLSQGLLNLRQDIGKEFILHGVANIYDDGEQRLGVTQLALVYKPLTASKTKWRARAGFFYPELSLENVDVGWLSPYTYTNSAINSWIGEELRTPGVEVSMIRPGRLRGSAWSWEVHASLFKANDPFGSLLAWRGWALHDRQSLNNDRIRIAPYPTVLAEDVIFGPDYVEPFHELDGRIGYYVGTHVDYYQSSTLRYYFYDNRADPNKVSAERLYAWHTRFHSVSAQHKFNANTRLIGQYMVGDSVMGEHFVYIDFDAWYLMLSHRIDKHRLSLRYDKFKVRDKGDIFPQDFNDSDGNAITAAWRYTLDENWQFGVEFHYNENTALNRSTLGEQQSIDQQQTQFVAQYRWR